MRFIVREVSEQLRPAVLRKKAQGALSLVQALAPVAPTSRPAILSGLETADLEVGATGEVIDGMREKLR